MSEKFNVGRGKFKSWPRAVSDAPMGLSFDDVNLVPRTSAITSRMQPDMSTRLGPLRLEVPIVAAPMDTASGDKMIRALAEKGALGTLPRAKDDEEFKNVNLKLAEKYAEEGIQCLFVVGKGNGFEQAQQLHERGAEVVLIDVANGGQTDIIELAKRIKGETGITIMAGNIATREHAKAYKKAKIDYARVGIGGGAVCTTREMTGVGIGQLSAILDTASTGIGVIADGGIRVPGDVAKAVAAGGGLVMVGSMIAGTDEAPGERLEIDGVMHAKYRGQASKEFMDDQGTKVTARRAAEGVSTWIPTKGPVGDVIDTITGGLSSSMSYVGAVDLADFRDRTSFARTTQASQVEAHPHAARTTHQR